MNQLPQIKPKGELQIGDADIKRHAPDLVVKAHEMGEDLATVHKFKPALDSILQPIAQKTGAKFSSRVKNSEMIVRKVVQKRMEDPKYQLSDINDLYGGRFVVQNEKQERQIKQAIEQAAKQGQFVIIEQQARDKDTYHAYHFDIAFPLSQTKSIRAEIQIMDQNSEAQAALTHDAHAKYSDNPPKPVEKSLNKQTKQVNELPPIKQKQIADTMVSAHKQTGDKPLPNGFGKKVIATVSKS